MMESRKEQLMSQFDRSSMKEFYERFTTPESQEKAFDILEKSQKITDQATKHLNDAIAVSLRRRPQGWRFSL